jgi:hypothetical protein
VDPTEEEEREEEERVLDDINVEEERGAGIVQEERDISMEEEAWRRTQRTRGRVCGGGRVVEGGRGVGAGTDGCGEMIGLRFGSSGALKKENSSDDR